MMKTPTILATLTISMLALAGCSAGDGSDQSQQSSLQSTPVATPAETPASTPAEAPEATPEPSELTSEEWGDEAMDLFLDSYGRDKFSQFSPGTPHQAIEDWQATSEGVLIVKISDGSQTIARLRWLAIEIYDRARSDVDQLSRVTVIRQGDEVSRTYPS